MKPHPLLLLLLGACAPPTFTGEACLNVDDDATTCPDGADVDVADAFVPMDCDETKVSSVSGDGTLEPMPSQVLDTASPDIVCCYAAELIDTTPNSDCMVGRPLPGHHAVPSGPGRAAAWRSAANGEHASVAAFAAVALELLAHGAPMDLVRDVLVAATEELDHTARCLTHAGGGDPGRLDIAALTPGRSLRSIAVDAVRDGCIVETLGAVAARAAAEAATEPDVAATLTRLRDDEERHAVLSWRIVAWALKVGGPDVRSAVREAFVQPVAPPDVGPLAVRAGVDPALLRAAVGAGLHEVVTPAARALLAA